jgi:hypothetical protein
MIRPLTDAEKRATMMLASAIASPEEREQTVEDACHCKVDDLLRDGSRLIFHIEGYQRPPYRGQDTFRGKDGFPVEGAVLDKEGNAIDVTLYSDQNNRLLELELIKLTSHVGNPDWETFHLK